MSPRITEEYTPRADVGLAPSSEAGAADGGLDADSAHSESCVKPGLHWQLLPRHGCTFREMVCVDQVDQHNLAPDRDMVRLGAAHMTYLAHAHAQGRFIVFGDERSVPGKNLTSLYVIV